MLVFVVPVAGSYRSYLVTTTPNRNFLRKCSRWSVTTPVVSGCGKIQVSGVPHCE